MVFDNQRKTLYTRTKKAKLGAYFLGMNGDSSIEKVGKVRTLSYESFVVCVSSLSKLESKWSHAHLVAVLLDETRMYFSTSSDGNDRSQTPDCLRLLTTPCLPDSLNDMKVEPAYCSGGFIFHSRPSPDSNSSTVFVVGKDSSTRTTVGVPLTMRELLSPLQIEGRMLFAAEVLPTPDATSAMLSLYSQLLGESYENTCVILRGRGDLLTQHLLPKK
ncbi:Nuclear pore complex protein [Cardamine amara subsp. amara]|uniref:Nuclear pore complex protein n=1 Tax=Cardamine amara subsp. amara TaxID=228776 RepID=A0ABD0Z9G0_CARAN